MYELEIDLENKFRKFVKKQKGLTYKWTGSREKLDLIVVSHTGFVGLLELKKPDGTGRLTPQQKKIIHDIKKIVPGVAVVSDRFDECVSWYHMLSVGMFTKTEEMVE